MIKHIIQSPDVADTARAVPVAAYISAWHLNLDMGQVVAFVGALYTLIVAVEKFYKVAQWVTKKLKKPPEG